MNKKLIKDLEKNLSELYKEQSDIAAKLDKAKKDLMLKEIGKNFPTIETLRELIPTYFSSVAAFSNPKNIFGDYTMVKKTEYTPNDVYDYCPPTIVILELSSPTKGTTYWSIMTNESSYSGYDSYDTWSIKKVKPVEVVETRWVVD